MLRITDIKPQGIAEELGIEAGDYVVKINDRPVNDRLDYRFFIADDQVEITIQRGAEQTIFDIEKDIEDDLGIVLEEMKLKACGNNCVFCFVYQNPKGMRKSLYFKDEDYRFSFMYGHYVTMTTLKQKDLDRIVEQRLSPIYISVQATEEKTRKLLLGINRDDHLLQKIEFLTSHGIELNAQIVLCPGINDGYIFDRTVYDLKQFFPGVQSIAVVPVGLTRHREGLMHLRLHNQSELQETIHYVNGMRDTLKKELGIHFVYLADEFFIKAGMPLPSADYYDEFYQIENGVGEFRKMIDRFNHKWPTMPKDIEKPLDVTWVTGTLAAGPLKRHIIDPLNTIPNLQIELVPVKNHFYGSSIEVSGLIVAEDIYRQLKNRSLGDIVLLPPRVLNDDGLFLDDWTLQDLQNELGVTCHVYTEELSEILSVLYALIHQPMTVQTG
ncbi:MAG: DUF512 domain-containing protein [Caldithrix sp.]|nr:DUF512 domain-containing protein [Caldithrix sp.]